MTLKSYQTRTILSQLVGEAIAEPLLSSTIRGSTVKQLVDMGQKIPEKMLPGRFIQRQPEAIREILRNLTSDDIQDPDRNILKYLSPDGKWKPRNRKSTFIMPF